jgi:hypothetical protein
VLLTENFARGVVNQRYQTRDQIAIRVVHDGAAADLVAVPDKQNPIPHARNLHNVAVGRASDYETVTIDVHRKVP